MSLFIVGVQVMAKSQKDRLKNKVSSEQHTKVIILQEKSFEYYKNRKKVLQEI